MLEIRSLVVGYDKPLIRPLDLRLGGGESAVFFGPNGVGKTTLAKTVASLLRPFGGSVLLDGVPTHKARSRIFYLSEAIEVPERVKAVDYVEALASFYGAGFGPGSSRRGGGARPASAGQDVPRHEAPPSWPRPWPSCPRWVSPSWTTRTSASPPRRRLRSTGSCCRGRRTPS